MISWAALYRMVSSKENEKLNLILTLFSSGPEIHGPEDFRWRGLRG